LDTDAVHRTPYDALLGDADKVITEWRAIIRPEPWADLPPSHLLDSLPEILPRLIRLARSGATHINDVLQDLISHDHGELRREDDVPVAAITEEWQALKRACGQVLARNGYVDAEATLALDRLDTLIDDAIGYTLRGYYREELNTLRGRGFERRDAARADRRRGSDDRRERSDDRRERSDDPQERAGGA
jgi:hypothetical protein